MRNSFLLEIMFFVLLLNLFSFSFSRKVFSGIVFHDRTVLLELKRGFSDSNGLLSSWGSDSSNHCSWYGVSCDSKSRVVSLNLSGCPGDTGSFDLADLSSCSRRLGGEISPSVGKLAEIRVLSLAFNDLGGELPAEIWGLEKLEVLDLQGNSFVGKFPGSVVGLKRITVLNLGLHQISGEIPAALTTSTNSEVSNPAENRLVPSILGFLTNFGKSRKIDLSKMVGLSLLRCRKRKDTSRPLSFLCNAVPGELGELPRGEVSEASGNGVKLRKLMGLDDGDKVPENDTSPNADNEMSQSPPGKDGLYPIEIASIVSASVIVFVLLVLVVLFFYTRKWKRNSQVQVAEPREIRVFVDIGVPLTYEKIVRATGYFSNSNCIGHGGFGSTYKAEVSPTIVVAVKRLSVGRFQGVQQFHAEILTLEMVRHPNLVTLIGYHASETEMFLIYNFLSGGNLEDFIKERSEAALDWKILHKIALDVARALAYLHEQCSPKVLHRDIKPSNILLDNNYNAYLSDFGLSKLLGTSQSHVTTGVAGTFGYVAPEYAMTCRVSEKADVYSYGIVLLELLSDKKALDPSFSSHENGFNIVSWAHMMLRQGKAKDVFAKGLWESGPQDDLVEVLHLALKCTVDSLSTRPTMKQVVQRLKQIQPSKC